MPRMRQVQKEHVAVLVTKLSGRLPRWSVTGTPAEIDDRMRASQSKGQRCDHHSELQAGIEDLIVRHGPHQTTGPNRMV